MRPSGTTTSKGTLDGLSPGYRNDDSSTDRPFTSSLPSWSQQTTRSPPTPTTRLKVLAFSLSAASAGIAGGLFAYMQSGIRPEDFRFDKSIDMIVMIIIGGLGSISGAVVGGVFVAVTLELMRDLQQYRLVLYALLLIIIMLVRPEGLLGTRELPALLRARFKRAKASEAAK